MNFTLIDTFKPHSFGVPSRQEIEDFENANGRVLPIDYKDFLQSINGGETLLSSVRGSTFCVNYILGMHNGDHSASLYSHIDIFSGRIPFDTFPIATDPFGNIYLMSLNPESYGGIYFWDHENELKDFDGNYIGNTSFVANTFADFIEQLN